MKRSAFKLITIAVAFLLALLPGLPVYAMAAEPVCTISVSAEYDGVPLTGFEVSAYRIAYLSEGNSFQMTDKFKGLPIGDMPTDTEGWNELALTFEGYCFALGVTPDITGITNDFGKVILAGKDGLYLIRSSKLTSDGFVYTSLSFFVYLNAQEGNTANLKLDRQPEEKFDCRKVLKVWDDYGNQGKRPEAITVVLYCDGEVYDSVSLNEECRWRYAWERLPIGHNWTVSEVVPRGYTVKIEDEGITFVITNTRPDIPDIPTEPHDKLPQTGLYWWPIPLLAVIGAAALVIGIRKRNEK